MVLIHASCVRICLGQHVLKRGYKSKGRWGMKQRLKLKKKNAQYKYWFMKKSNRIVLEIWMFKIDKPSGKADLHNRPLLDLADTETHCDNAKHKSFTGLNYSSPDTLV